MGLIGVFRKYSLCYALGFVRATQGHVSYRLALAWAAP